MNIGAHKNEHQTDYKFPNLLDAVGWDHLRFFLSTADNGSFRATAHALNTSTNVVRSRIEELEKEMDCVLFFRSSSGVELTQDGRMVYSVALSVKDQIAMLKSVGSTKSSELSGLVRIGVTEGLGSFWLATNTRALQEKYPELTIELKCEMRVQDISMTDCHITVQLEKPRDQSLIIRKLGYLHFMIFGTQDYIDRYGYVKSKADLVNHDMAHLVAEQVPSELLEKQIKDNPIYKYVRVIASTSSAQAYSIRSGNTVGLLPTYASKIDSTLIPMPIDFELKRPIYLVYSREMKQLRRVRATKDWLIDIFNPQKYPWFREEFVPQELF